MTGPRRQALRQVGAEREVRGCLRERLREESHLRPGQPGSGCGARSTGSSGDSYYHGHVKRVLPATSGVAFGGRTVGKINHPQYEYCRWQRAGQKELSAQTPRPGGDRACEHAFVTSHGSIYGQFRRVGKVA